MRKIVVLFLVASSSCFGALSPFYQSSREIQTILESRELGEYFTKQEAIEAIIKVPNGYEITTETQTVLAEVIYSNENRIGPRKFRIELHAPSPPRSPR